MVWFILKDFCKPKVQPNLRKCQLKARSKQLLQPVVNVSSSHFWINPFLSNVPFCSQLWLSDIFTAIKIESLGRNELVTVSSDLTDLSLASNESCYWTHNFTRKISEILWMETWFYMVGAYIKILNSQIFQLLTCFFLIFIFKSLSQFETWKSAISEVLIILHQFLTISSCHLGLSVANRMIQ